MHRFLRGATHLRHRRAAVAFSLLLISVITATIITHPFASRAAGSLPFTDAASFVAWMRSHHKAPFRFDIGIPGATQQTSSTVPPASVSNAATPTNVRVNQDRNPWPKSEIAAAVDPTNGNNYVVMSNDYRERSVRTWYHVSTDGGQHFTDDTITTSTDSVTQTAYTFRTDPRVAFDLASHSFLTSQAGNFISDATNGYINFDSEIDLVEGFANGQYTDILPTAIDHQPCYETFTSTSTNVNCPAQLQQAQVTVDTVAGSPHQGTIYVTYTFFCNGAGNNQDQPCTDGPVTLPPFSSAILESHAAGAGLPFSPPSLVSGSVIGPEFSDMVIDSHGTPHIFFNDYSGFTFFMDESTFTGNTWTVNPTPVTTFANGLPNNSHWQFSAFGEDAPRCGIRNDTAYCAFADDQVGTGPAESTPSVYLAAIDTLTGTATIHRVNNDPFGDTKDHLFPWASVAPNGAVYVGWYDNRNDPTNAKVDYFVGKSTDGGVTFPTQKAVNATSFNPCANAAFCGLFGGAYTQLVIGPDGVTHAAWSDTRDGESVQIFSARITF